MVRIKEGTSFFQGLQGMVSVNATVLSGLPQGAEWHRAAQRPDCEPQAHNTPRSLPGWPGKAQATPGLSFPTCNSKGFDTDMAPTPFQGARQPHHSCPLLSLPQGNNSAWPADSSAYLSGLCRLLSSQRVPGNPKVTATTWYIMFRGQLCPWGSGAGRRLQSQIFCGQKEWG